jgi:hypothetical protein
MIPKQRLGSLIALLSPGRMVEVDRALAFALGLDVAELWSWDLGVEGVVDWWIGALVNWGLGGGAHSAWLEPARRSVLRAGSVTDCLSGRPGQMAGAAGIATRPAGCTLAG